MADKLDDEYLANLLKQEAKASAKQYELVGLDAFNPKRPKAGAPKPNTNFLRNIIRQTDSHNAALLAKEAEESSARLRLMDRAKERGREKEEELRSMRADGRLTPLHSDDDVRSRHTRGRGRSGHSVDGPDSSNKKGRRRHRRRDRSRSPLSAYRTSKSSRTTTRQVDSSRKSRQRSVSSPSDSDPLEAIVGPLPPPTQPIVRPRGRGAQMANMTGTESRFSSNYDPHIDIGPSPDAEDDWADSVEAFRDRQQWRQEGVERLKAVGFTDAQIKKWEKGEEPNEDDVVWARKGEAREWDRGKVVDEDGDIQMKADFGRLK
ncbi:hypothetical protein IQ07DRAFT_594168 [Pyrenochaeta sp. DS3sAY3a]|nr:hypothetical protein IQ07DRAFT_594168 [Pyrenochaeta sp. DS3sAY3a]